ncbi:transposase [Dolichospermum compactum]|uniref:transposase n=1 Tax=Dolichospermum compactum TaxID=136073 RepID=UPI000BBC00A2
MRPYGFGEKEFIENPKLATNKKIRRQLRIRQRRVNRKVKGSNNRKKAGKIVAKLHKKNADKRNDLIINGKQPIKLLTPLRQLSKMI